MRKLAIAGALALVIGLGAGWYYVAGPGGKDVHLWMATKPGQGWRVVVFDRAGLARALDEILK